jgi:hypothetical protein
MSGSFPSGVSDRKSKVMSIGRRLSILRIADGVRSSMSG